MPIADGSATAAHMTFTGPQICKDVTWRIHNYDPTRDAALKSDNVQLYKYGR